LVAKNKIMKRVLLPLALLALISCSEKEQKYSDYPISAVDIKKVVINDNFWLPKIKVVQDTTISFSFNKCDEEGRMENFLIAGGKKEGKTRGKMPFDDTDLYKIIEGASYSLISSPDPKLDAYLDSMIEIIKTGQEPDGYLTTWITIDKMNPPASWANPSPNRWQFEVTNHELYNSGHLFEAAAAHYWATGKRNMLDIALKNADLLVDNFGKDKLQIPPGHQIVETGLIKLYNITKNEKYLELAKFYLDARGDSTTHQLYGAYSQDHVPVTMQNEAVGHAVRAVYMYAGMTDIAAIYKDNSYLNAVNAIWDNMVNKKMYLTGGIGSRHDGEAFGDDYELPNLTAYNETCAAIGNVYWNQRLFQMTGDSKYYDIIERSLYNGLIAGISISGNKFFYPNPLESDGKYIFNHGNCTRSPWFDCSCCPTNLIRFIPSVHGLIYSTEKDTLFVNLFISNNAETEVNGKKIKVSQQTDYPWKGKIRMNVMSESKNKFTLKIRVPGWAQNQVLPGDLYQYTDNNNEAITLNVNGEEKTADIKNGYIEITKEWSENDNVEVNIPMNVRMVTTNENVASNSGKVAIERGPVVYCIEDADNNDISDIIIPENIVLTPEEKTVITEKVQALKGSVNGKEITMIPYYAWSNRGIGKMKVWIDKSKN
jgi:hypothetical protein